MPSRFVSLVILIYWSIAAFCLLTWDVLPELTMGYPPDLRAIAFASDSTRPVRWSIQVIDDPRSPDVRRTVGEAVTASSRQARRLVRDDQPGRVRRRRTCCKGTPFSTRSSIRLEVESRYHVDPSGNLHSFDARGQVARVRRDAGRGQGPAQGEDDGDRLARARCRS